jgi:hypothetical protein
MSDNKTTGVITNFFFGAGIIFLVWQIEYPQMGGSTIFPIMFGMGAILAAMTGIWYELKN